MSTDPAQLRRRREDLGFSQTHVAEAAELSLSTVQKFERGVHVAKSSVRRIGDAIERLEAESRVPKPRTIEVPESDLRAVLEELRAFRRLYEDDAETLRELAVRVERLEARHGNGPSR